MSSKGRPQANKSAGVEQELGSKAQGRQWHLWKGLNIGDKQRRIENLLTLESVQGFQFGPHVAGSDPMQSTQTPRQALQCALRCISPL